MGRFDRVKLGLLALTSVLLFACGPRTGAAPEMPSGSYMIEDAKIKVNLDQTPSLNKVGGAAKITSPSLSEPILVFRTSEKGFVALSLTCTTKGNELEYRPEEKIFQCLGTGIQVGLDAGVLKGKPDKKIRLYSTNLGILDRDKLIIRID